MKSIITILILLSHFSYSFSQVDACGSATALAVNTSCTTSAFNVNQDGTSQDGNASCATGTAYEDSWYTVVGTGNTMTITVSGTNRDLCLAAFTSCVGGQLACTMLASGVSGSINFATTNGVTYLIQIQRRSGNSSNNLTGNICAVSAAPVGVGNDLCSGATAVSCENTYTGTTVGASDAGETALSACGTSPSAAGVWYVFTGDGSTVTASLCSGTSYDSKINVYSSPSNCAGINTCVASNDDGCGSASTVTFATIVGRNYYILVNGYSGATGAFSLAITCCTPGAPSCPTLNSPANAATGVAQCSSLAWTAPATSGCSSVDSYDVYFGTTNPPAFLANTTSTSYPITTSPSTVYYWQIRSKNSSGVSAACSVRSFTAAATGNPQYTTVDDANSASPYDCVNLTSTTNDQRGCAWDLNSILNFTSNFSYDFTVNLGNSDGGGDGMAFVMQNDPQGRCKCGTTGEALGAGGISNSVIVEIDTYLNTNDRDDFSSSFIGCGGSEEPDHLDIWYNGTINPDLDSDCDAMGAGERPAVSSAVRLRNGGTNYNIENGNNHVLRIDWASATNTLTARVLNSTLNVTYGTISTTFNPMTVFGTNTPYFGFTASTGGLNNAQTFCNPTSLLPIQLMSFNSYCYENYRKIYWSTASENNNQYFTIEKSYDGINFHFFQQVTASGEKSLGAEYEIVDNDLTSKIVYYRLSQTDYNGVSKTFDIISSECKTQNNTFSIEKIFENKEEFILQIHATESENHELNIYDISGQLIFENNQQLEKGVNEIKISKNHLSNGMYFFQLKNSKAQITKKHFVLD